MAERLPDEAGPLGAAAPLVERLRRVHLEMVEAVLGGEGLGRVAELAAAAAGAPVAVVVPRLDEAVAAPTPVKRIDALRRYVVDKLRDRPVRVPDGIVAEVPIASGDEVIGAVLLLDAAADVAAPEFLHLAAVASLTEVAIAEARDEVEQNLRGSLLEELRTRPDAIDAREIVRRAGRLGCDLSQGGVALCAKLTSDRPRHVVALITGEYGGALAQHMEGRVYALLPSVQEGSPLETQDAARRLAGRLERYGAVGLSSFYSEAADLPRGLQEAELVVDVLEQSDGAITEDIGTGTYRLLFRVLASHPEEVRSFFEDTVAPLVRYDDQYGTDLVGTLDAYLENNCNMNATAAMIYAHRHTVAYRLDRVRELTGLDPVRSEDRERLGLGLKAYRIIAPRLPR
jgi:sugar diacid utilization regulator